jgi:hypothetical protein
MRRDMATGPDGTVAAYTCTEAQVRDFIGNGVREVRRSRERGRHAREQFARIDRVLMRLDNPSCRCYGELAGYGWIFNVCPIHAEAAKGVFA